MPCPHSPETAGEMTAEHGHYPVNNHRTFSHAMTNSCPPAKIKPTELPCSSPTGLPRDEAGLIPDYQRGKKNQFCDPFTQHNGSQASKRILCMMLMTRKERVRGSHFWVIAGNSGAQKILDSSGDFLVATI